MLNFDSIKNVLNKSKITSKDNEKLKEIVLSMDDDKLKGAYELIRPEGDNKLSDYDAFLFDLIKKELIVRGFSFDYMQNIVDKCSL